MILEDRIYCIHCNGVLPIEQAQTVFRTGFYMVSMRLGICRECNERNSEKEIAALMESANLSQLQENNLSAKNMG